MDLLDLGFRLIHHESGMGVILNEHQITAAFMGAPIFEDLRHNSAQH